MKRPISRKSTHAPKECDPPRGMGDVDFLRTVWQDLTPAERSRRSWRMRKRMPDPEAVHDAKLWPRI